MQHAQRENSTEEASTHGSSALGIVKVIWEYVWTLGLMALIVFSARSSLADWYEVPSGSMLPTIQLGDRIFVNKLAYDLRVPFSGSYLPRTQIQIPFMRLARMGEPQRGDIVVFVYPVDGRTDYVKRLVGLPGDTLRLERDQLYVNGERMDRSQAGPERLPPGAEVGMDQRLFIERLDGVEHFVFETHDDAENFPSLTVPGRGLTVKLTAENFRFYERSLRDNEGLSGIELRDGMVFDGRTPLSSHTFTRDYYFMMGDNRDNSADSRFWGFVPGENLRGRALRVVLSFDPALPIVNPARVRLNRALLPIDRIP